MIKKINKLIGIMSVKFYRDIFISKHVAAGIENEEFFNYLNSKEFETIVDIGANRGQFALVGRRHFSNANIYSFEPLNEPAVIFRSIFAKDIRTKLYEFAIGPEETKSTIHISYADDASSLLPITNLQCELYPGTSEKDTRMIIVKPLDAILTTADIQMPALLKIDVQGFEKQVLEGCKSLLPLFSYVYIECSFVELYKGQALAHEIISFLLDCRFILNGVYNIDKDKKGIPVQGDFLFTQQNPSNQES